MFQNVICAGARGGGIVRATVIHNFYDKENDLVLRTVGEELDVSSKRAEYLAGKSLVQIIENQKGGDPESPTETKG